MGIIKVEMFEYKKAQKPDVLTSGGLGPCIAVGAIYDTIGYMSHSVDTEQVSYELDALLDVLRREANPRRTKIYIAGGGLDSEFPSLIQGILNSRRITLEKIAAAGFKPTKIQWGLGNSRQKLILDFKKGKTVYEEISDEDDESHFSDEYYCD
ncbi:MAG TPA: hypothetical protein VJB66_01935 [Candidatus Nanoarchaeia archaeon]|nr:hypothetical protein [Candidatus Nanoarchaeia archaeon]